MTTAAKIIACDVLRDEVNLVAGDLEIEFVEALLHDHPEQMRDPIAFETVILMAEYLVHTGCDSDLFAAAASKTTCDLCNAECKLPCRSCDRMACYPCYKRGGRRDCAEGPKGTCLFTTEGLDTHRRHNNPFFTSLKSKGLAANTASRTNAARTAITQQVTPSTLT